MALSNQKNGLHPSAGSFKNTPGEPIWEAYWLGKIERGDLFSPAKENAHNDRKPASKEKKINSRKSVKRSADLWRLSGNTGNHPTEEKRT